ncbi:MAG TPA: PadR family transcriptional regulator [Chloroflexota bacterium]|nr:PadR family transcriptional regulator [Chloroflexota bacterium]
MHRNWRRPDWGDDFSGLFGGRPWAQRQAERVRERMFGRGDLKYVILDLLRDQPRHGYDVIRELEFRFAGFYTPSAGVIYPTLQMLEDMGAVTSMQQEGRRVYTITDEGRRILEERRGVLDDIAGRVRSWMEREGGAELHRATRELADLVGLLAHGSRVAWGTPARLNAIRDLIGRTKDELRTILTESPPRREEF